MELVGAVLLIPNGDALSSVALGGNNELIVGGPLTAADAVGAPGFNLLGSEAFNMAYRGVTGNVWDRIRSLSPDTLGGASTAIGVQAVGQIAQWTIEHHPAAGAAASATKAAAGAGIRHVAVGGIASLAAGAAAAGIVNVFLRDGASGAGAILASAVLTAPVNGLSVFSFGPTAIRGTAATQMTWELSAAGGAASQSAVTLWGYDVSN